ncbi:putative F-box protein At3g23970 [Fagus crenata]
MPMLMPTIMDDLHDDLLVEILHQLPLKSTFQCKSHYFTETLKRLLFVTSKETEFKSFKSFSSKNITPKVLLDQHNVNIDLTIQASCNDLLLCCTKIESLKCIYYVINPVTMQWLALPPVRQHETPLHGFICSYDKHKQLTYRVLHLLKIKDKNMEIKVDMFSSDTREWTKSLVSCPRRFDLSFFATAAVVYKDLLFWWEIKRNRIVGCDPNNYRFFELPIQMEHGIDYFGLCGGSLRICEIPGQEDPSLLRVWVLKDFVKNEDKWCLEHEVYFNQMTWKNSTWLTEYVKVSLCASVRLSS